MGSPVPSDRSTPVAKRAAQRGPRLTLSPNRTGDEMTFPSSRSLRLSSVASLLVVLVLTGCASQPKPVAQKKAAFWPQYPDEPRIQFLTAIHQSSDVEPAKSKLDELVLGKEAHEVLPISKPYGIEMWNGRIYVTDLRNASVTIFDLRNHKTLMMGKGGSDPLERPSDIAIAPDGLKYVTDLGKGRVVVFDAQDRQLNSLGTQGMKPVGVAVWQNELYVCDFATQTVQVLDRFSGQPLRAVGGPGTGDGQFIRPLGVEVDAQGNVYVMDVLKCQLQKFNHQGQLVTKFGTTSANAGGFVRPKQLAVDKDGTIYVVDAAFQNVQLLDQAGRPLTFFGSPGGHPGAMYLPAGICVHEGDLDLFQQYVHPAFQPERLILVTNQFGDNKISVYAMGHLKAGKTVADISQSQGVVPSGVGDKRNGPAPLAQSATAPADQPVAQPVAAPAPAAASAPPAAAANAAQSNVPATPAGATPAAQAPVSWQKK